MIRVGVPADLPAVRDVFRRARLSNAGDRVAVGFMSFGVANAEFGQAPSITAATAPCNTPPSDAKSFSYSINTTAVVFGSMDTAQFLIAWWMLGR